MVVDQKNGFVYFSFTDRLIKTDLSGNLVGSVTGFAGHLGDLDVNPENGIIYGSLEYKSDAIGKGISKTLGRQDHTENGFYIAVIDGSRIVRPNMNAEQEDLLNTVYIAEAVKDYEGFGLPSIGKKPHRFACSGIDGVAFAPAIGSPETSKKYLYVAYGVYGDTTRNDNDYQVLLKYDVTGWNRYGQKFSQEKLHHSGPAAPMEKYLVKTGNTRYGIQNLAYDPYTGNLFAAVYRGGKTEFPNYDIFVIDAHTKPIKQKIFLGEERLKVKTLSLLNAGSVDVKTGIRGWHFQWGATGLCPIGEGLFYISHDKKDKDGQQQTTLHKYRWIGDSQHSFVKEEGDF